MSFLYLDLETENKPWYGALASPRNPENYVVLNGWAQDDGEVMHIHNENVAQAKSRDWLVIPDDVTMIVCHNAPFELDWMLHQQREIVSKFLKRGGRFFCTAYAHYLLSNQRDTYPSLNEIAPIYGGTHKVDGVKALWEQGKLTSEIDPELLLRYLIDPNEGDVANTRTIFRQQYAMLQERGMWEMALERMEGLLFCAYAMDAGLLIDREIAFRQLAEGEATLAALRESFAAFRSDFPVHVEFKETSDFHMSAWLFGGPVKYRHKVPRFKDGVPVMVKADAVVMTEPAPMTVLLNDEGLMPVQVGEVIEWHRPDDACLKFNFDFVRYKSGKNKGLIKVTREDTQIQATVYEDTHYMCPPLVPLTNLSAALREEFLKDFTGKRKLADESPVISTGKDALKFLSQRKEFPEDVQKVLKDLNTFNKVDKDMGTYYLRQVMDDDGKVTKQSGMLQYMDDLDIVHHTLNCTSTVTTRLSSNRPNFQNIPRGNTSDVKKMFVSRFDSPKWLIWALENQRIDQAFFDRCMHNLRVGKKNGYIVELDYSALEVVTLAAFSQDKNLIAALLNDIDMHCLRLSAQLGEPYEDVLRKCKDEDDPEHARYDAMRTDIKPKAFAYQYGATAMGIAFATGCTVEDAQAFIDSEKQQFPDVERFFDDEITPAVNRSVTQHHEQDDNGNWRAFGRGVWQSPGGTNYEFRQWPKTVTSWVGGHKIRQTIMDFKPTQIRNYPIQGESGFFVQGISGLVVRWMIANDFFQGRCYVINTVHDAIYLDCHHEVLDVVCHGVKSIMESLPTYFSQKYGYNLNVPFPAAAEFGGSMAEKRKWKEGVLNEPVQEG